METSGDSAHLKKTGTSATFNPVLFEEDAIMRPDILHQLSIFIENHGKIETALEKITPTLLKNYCGYQNMIAVITDTLKKSGYSESQTIINNCVQTTMRKLFRVSDMDNLLLTHSKVPREFQNMFESPFWVDTFIALSKNNPDSLFLGYCMNKICKKHQNLVTYLPPYTISYRAYINVLQYILQEMKSKYTQDLYDKFIRIISTDDRTLTHAAIAFHHLSVESILKIADKLESISHRKRDIFNKVSLAMDSSCNDHITQIITSQQPLTIQQMREASEVEELPPRIKFLFIKKLSELLKARGNRPEMIETAVNCLLKMTNTEVSSDKHSYICASLQYIQRFSPLYEKVNLARLLNCLDIPCFVDIFLELTLAQLNNSITSRAGSPGNSPQSLILKEIGFHHRHLVTKIIDALIKAIGNNQSADDILREIFATLVYFIELGYSIYILTSYSKLIKAKIRNSPSEHRGFIRKLLNLNYPKNFDEIPVKKFIEGMAVIFANDDIMRLIIPEQTIGTLGRIDRESMLELKRFLDQIPSDITLTPYAMASLEAVNQRVSVFNL